MQKTSFSSDNHSFILKRFKPLNISELGERQNFKCHLTAKKSGFKLKDDKIGNFIWLLLKKKIPSYSQASANSLSLLSLKACGNNHTNG